jgi:hypothetical protein
MSAMALGQIGAPSAYGRSDSTATTTRSTPIPPTLTRPRNTGLARAPRGFNNSMGRTRPDRPVTGRNPGPQPGPQPGSQPDPGTFGVPQPPKVNRGPRPLIMDRAVGSMSPQPTAYPQQPQAYPQPQPTAYPNTQPQLPTYGTPGQQFALQSFNMLAPQSAAAYANRGPRTFGPFAPTPATDPQRFSTSLPASHPPISPPTSTMQPVYRGG